MHNEHLISTLDQIESAVSLFNIFDSIEPLNNDLRDFLYSRLEKEKVKKKHYFLRENQISRHIYFLESGLVQCYRNTEIGPTTMWIMKENDIFLSVGSFFSQSRSFDNIVALQDCVAWHISWTDLQYAYKTWPQFNLHRGVILEKYYNMSEIRGYRRQMPSLEAFQLFTKEEPELFGRVHDKILASYLGMTPQSFSNAKKRHFKQR